MTNGTRRRDLLCGAGALAAGSLGGCLGRITGESGDDGDFSVASAGPNYEPWVHAPGALGDRDHYAFEYVGLSAYVEAEQHFQEETYRQVTQQFEQNTLFLAGDLSIDDVDWYLDLAPTASEQRTVLRGEFDAGAVLAGFEDSDRFETGERHEGYEIVTVDSDVSAAIAVGENAMVLDAGYDDAGENVRALIDAGASGASGYAASSSDMAELYGHLAPADQVYAGTREPASADEESVADGTFEGQVGFGTSGTFEDDVLASRYMVTFESEDDVDSERVREWVDENRDDGERFADVYDVTVDAVGRSAIVDGSIDVADR